MHAQLAQVEVEAVDTLRGDIPLVEGDILRRSSAIGINISIPNAVQILLQDI
jgi:hypothetical protein